MSDKQTLEITVILQAWNDGDADAKERLMPFVYDELKRQARILMSRERGKSHFAADRAGSRSVYEIGGRFRR